MKSVYIHIIALATFFQLAACSAGDEGSSGSSVSRDGAAAGGVVASAGAQSDAPTSAINALPGVPGARGSAAAGDLQEAGEGDSRPGALPAPAQVGTSTQAAEVLLRAERAFEQVRSMEASFSQDVYVPLLESSQRSRGTIYHRSPDRFLMRFTDPQGDVIVADGRYVWMYYPSTDDRQVMRATLGAGGQQVDLYREFLGNATQRYTATHNGPESVGGRPAQALTLVPRQDSSYERVRIWVDDQDSLVRRFEITEENGSVRKLEMTGLRVNVTLADNLFRFTPPAGAQVHDF